jgi:hypothetical protein
MCIFAQMCKLVQILCFVVALGSAGSQSIGSRVIGQSHPHSNSAMVSMIDSQLLTNIVPLKYRENPRFLEVSGITESRDISFDGGLKSVEWFPMI